MLTVENTENSGEIFNIFVQIWAILFLFETYFFEEYVENLKNKRHFLTDTVKKQKIPVYF